MTFAADPLFLDDAPHPKVPDDPDKKNVRRTITSDCVELVKHFEGFHATPFLSVGKVWVIGYGHNRTVRSGMEITEEIARDLLIDDLNVVARVVQRLVVVPLSDCQFDALTAFAYHVTVNAFEKSTLLKLLNRGWYTQVPVQLRRWNRAGGREWQELNHRRNAEVRLWNKAPGGKQDV